MPLKSRKVLLILIWAKTNKDREQVSKHGFTFISYQCSTFFVFLVFEVFLYLKKFSEISWNLIEYRLLYSDANAVKREEEAIKVDELNVAQIKELRDKVR